VNKRKPEALVRQIVRIAKNVGNTDHRGSRRTRHLGYPEASFTLIDDVADQYDDLVRELLRHADWEEKFSEQYIDQALRNLFGAVLGDNQSSADLSERASQGLNALEARLEGYSQKHSCYVPLVGLQLSAGDIALGQVVLKELSREVVDRLTSTVDSIILSTKGPEEQKQPLISMHEAMLRSLEGTICAEFRAIAEPNKARERAEVEVRRVLDLLRFAIPAMYTPEWKVAVGFSGEIYPASRITPTLSDTAFNLNVVNVGPHTSMELSEANMKVMQEIGVLEVSEILRKPFRHLSDFEDTLLRGMHWFADAETQPELENRLLSLITCLETFLTPRDRSPIRTAVAEGVAMIATEGVESRRKVKKFVLRVYDQRSAVSHGGRTAILQADLGQLRDITHSLIQILIRRNNEFSTRDDLADWLEQQRLA
jgi:hypothetical protein